MSVLEETGAIVNVSLKITAIEFWRKPWSCVPCGHHAGVQFEGDYAILKSYFLKHAAPWHVFLNGVT
jgi:hypothetical protein